MTEDPGGTAGATTDGDDMVAGNTPTEATEAAGMTTVTGITQEPERKAQVTENPEAGGTPGGRLETGRTEGGTTAAMTWAPATAIRTPQVVARAAGSQEDGRMEPWNTKGDHLSVTTRESAHRSDETPQQYE